MVGETMGQVATFGNVKAFHVNIEWRNDYGSEGSIGMTWGDLQLWLGDTLVWGEQAGSGRTKGITWNWIELLEFLGNAWPYLTEEEQYPIAFDTQEEPRHLGELSGKARLRSRKLSDEIADQEDELLRDFLVVHDFSEALHGIFSPQLLCLRRGRQMLLATAQQEFVFSFTETMSTLESIGNEIVQRISGLTDKRSCIASGRWQKRNEMSNLQKLQIATGIDAALLHHIWPQDVESAANDNLYELKAAARMAGGKVSRDQLKSILKQIKQLARGKPLHLDDLWGKARHIVWEYKDEIPAVQGYALALMLRKHIQCSDRVEPDEILQQWGVKFQKLESKDSTLDAIDAIAVWSLKYTPIILFNPDGFRSRYMTGKRATLAHEICHILVDIEGALPVIEVLGGNVPRLIEQRANAFAAEFLLPRSKAGDYYKQALKYFYSQDERNTTIHQAINKLVEKYGVSHETVAWQILNSSCAEENDKPTLEKYQKSVFDPF
jgi:Zn-dependent peptidase ImmA (M78 family)